MNNHPKIIFVIGNPCSGKSTFSRYVAKSDYLNVGDISPLYEIFHGDEILSQDSDDLQRKLKMWEDYLDTVEFVKELWSHEITAKPCNVYSAPAADGGFNILKPEAWDLVLKLSAQTLSNQHKYIFEFSRGVDVKYLEMKEIQKEDVYREAFKTILSSMKDGFIGQCAIVNFYSDLDDRKARNQNRFRQGGHLVSSKGMNKIYKEDIFKYTSKSEGVGYLQLDEDKLPVVSVKVPELNEADQEPFFLDVFNQVVECFNKFKGEC